MKQAAQKLGNAVSVIAVYGITLILLAYGGLQLKPATVAAVIPYSTDNLSIDTRPELPAQTVSGIPIHMNIDSLGMDKDIQPGTYDRDAGGWRVSPRGIHFAEASSPVNDLMGSTLIYGHNNKHVFGPLKRLKPGDTASIKTDNGYLFTYRFVQKSDTQPKDISIFSYQGEPTLTLQTCSGLFNEIRTFYTFRLVGFKKL